MAKKKSSSEVQELLQASKKSGQKKPVIHGDKISELKKGEGLHILNSEWKLKTPIPSYYYSKYNKKGSQKVACTKLEDGYLIVKK